MTQTELKEWFLNPSNYLKNGTFNPHITRAVAASQEPLYRDLRESLFRFTSFLPESSSLRERRFCITHNISERPKCICGKECNFNEKDGYQKHCSSECHRKDPEVIKKRIKYGKDSHFYGKHPTPETLAKISKSLKGRKPTETTLAKLRGRTPPNKGVPMSTEARKNLRLKSLKRLENLGGVVPSYNRVACEFFKQLDETLNTKGQYALYGGGERRLACGFFPDYINDSEKLIIEWDEEYHQSQQARDFLREQEIQEEFPDYVIIRLNHSEDLEYQLRVLLQKIEKS